MRTAPTNWSTIVAGGNYKYECKINVAGVDVLQSGIYELSINGSAIGQDAASIGYAIAGEIDISLHIEDRDDPDVNLDGGTFIWTDGDNADGGSFWSGGIDADGGTFIGIYIPKMAKLIPYVRVVDEGNGNVSGWLKMGEYFIDTREKDVKNGKFKAHGYDAMLKAEQTYLPSVTDQPMPTVDIVSEIATMIQVSIESSTFTALGVTPYSVPYYAGQYTAREMLGYIAAAYGGSFIIDEEGRLKLIRLTDSPATIDIGAKAASFDISEETLSYDKVTIVIDATHAITSGSGNSELEFDCPFGTQAMADRLLSNLGGYQYRGYSAGTAVITPRYQLGDAVLIKGNRLQIFKRALRFNALMASDLEAPYSEELQHEFTYEPSTERKIERYYNQVQSEFSVQASEIASKVSETDFTGNTVVSKINQNATTVAIEASKINLNGAVTANDYFKILTDGTFQANRGEVGDLVLEDGKLMATFNKGTYYNVDVLRADAIAIGQIEPTERDYERYDLNGDGVISEEDVDFIRYAIENYDGKIEVSTIINPRTTSDIAVFSVMDKETSIGLAGVKTNAVTIGGHKVDNFVVGSLKTSQIGYIYDNDTFLINGVENLGSVNFPTSNSWGYSYFQSFSVVFSQATMPALTDVRSVLVSVESDNGLIAATVTSFDTTGFSGWIWSPKSETRTIRLHYIITGTINIP